MIPGLGGRAGLGILSIRGSDSGSASALRMPRPVRPLHSLRTPPPPAPPTWIYCLFQLHLRSHPKLVREPLKYLSISVVASWRSRQHFRNHDDEWHRETRGRYASKGRPDVDGKTRALYVDFFSWSWTITNAIVN